MSNRHIAVKLSAGTALGFVPDEVTLFVILSYVVQTGFLAGNRADLFLLGGIIRLTPALAGEDRDRGHRQRHDSHCGG